MRTVAVTMEPADSSGTEFVSMPHLVIKDETHDDPEVAETNFTQQNHYLQPEPDPMNLLDPMYDSQQEISADAEEQQQHHSGITPEIWQDWMAEYPWLLHEETDQNEGYCLYCNITVSYKLSKTPRHHALTRNHREYEENYLAFKESEDQANMSVPANSVTIKQEFGTDSDISAIKYKRMSQTEPLFNFIWRRWQKRHTWLERDKDEMTYGTCKYCKQRICVEFAYMRMRHEVGIKHRIAVKRARKSNRKKSLDSRKGQNQATEIIENENEPENEQELDAQIDEEVEGERGETEGEQSQMDVEQESDEVRLTTKRKRRARGTLHMNPWLELDNSSPQTCRCKLCNVKMHSSNFQRHLHTQVHQERERNIKARNMAPNVKQEISVRAKNWKLYAKKHDWLIEDPRDGNFGYCKYCKKRLLCAIHPLKRLIHERGEAHKRAVQKYLRKEGRENDKQNEINDINEEVGGDEQQEMEELEHQEQNTEEEENAIADEVYEEEAEEFANNEDDIEKENNEQDNIDGEHDYDEEDLQMQENETETSRVRYPIGSDEWYAVYPWCKPCKEDPNFMFCSYCKTKLKLTFRRKQHERSTRHQEASKAVQKVQNLTNWERSRQDKRIKYYPWLVYTKNPQFVFCKYCRIRIHKGHSRTKHEATRRHRESREAFNSKKEQQSSTTVNTTPSNSIQETSTTKTSLSRNNHLMSAQDPRLIKSKVPLWKHRFPWLIFRRNEVQPNYGYCKFCEMRVYMLTEKFALKHQKSLKHIRIRISLKRQEKNAQKKQIPEQNKETTTTTTTTTATAVTERTLDASVDKQQQKDFPWLMPDIHNDPHYGICKLCNVRINILGILKIRHQQTLKHRKAESELNQQNIEEISDKTKPADTDDDADPDVVVIEDNDENDDSVKVEPLNEDDVLEYLLQRSDQAKTTKNSRNNDGAESTESQNNKRQQQQQHSSNRDNLIDRAQRLTTAHLEILRLTREFRDRNEAKKNSLSSSIFNTSASIASILSPTQAPPPPPTPTPATPIITPTKPVARNNFELFFDSVCESVKSLPSDLAAEGKIKIAQLVADLEMRALQRSQHKDLQAANLRQNNDTPISSRSGNDNASPILSNADVPSTNTNGFDRGEHNTMSTINTDAAQQQSASRYSLDNKLRIVPISSLIEPSPLRKPTNNSHQSKASMDSSSNAYQMKEGNPKAHATPQAKHIQMNPAYHHSVANQKSDISAARFHNSNTSGTPHTIAHSTPHSAPHLTPHSTPPHTTPHRIQNQNLNMPLSSTLPQYQPAQKIVSSPDSVSSSPRSVSQSSHTHTNATLIDNGIRRIHLVNSRPLPVPQQVTSGLGFRQIHLPLKGTTMAKANATVHINSNANGKPSSSSSSSSSSSYINLTHNT